MRRKNTQAINNDNQIPSYLETENRFTLLRDTKNVLDEIEEHVSIYCS